MSVSSATNDTAIDGPVIAAIGDNTEFDGLVHRVKRVNRYMNGMVYVMVCNQRRYEPSPTPKQLTCLACIAG